MTGSCLAQGRLLLGTLRKDKRASGVESAAAGRIERRGHLSCKNNFVVLQVRMVWENCGEQCLGVRMQDIAEQFFSGSVIDNLSQVHHGCLMSHVPDRRQIMRDQQIGDIVTLLDVFEQV